MKSAVRSIKRSLILFLVTVHCFSAHPIIISSNTGDGFNSNRDDGLRDPTEFALHRQRRDAIGKNLEATVTHLQQTARIVNAIALQQGLAAGTININTLIPELLIFGDVTLDEIVKLDDNLPNTLSSLKDLPTKVGDSPDVKSFEKKFIAVSTVLTAFSRFENVSEWKGRSDFTDDIEKMIKKDVDMGFIGNISSCTASWKYIFPKLKALGTTDFTAEHQKQLRELKECTENLIELSSKEFPNPVFFKNNNSASTAFSGVTRLFDAFKVLDSNMNDLRSQPGNKEMENSLKEISAFSSNINANGPIEVLQRLFVWKLSPSSFRSTKFTSGLPKGYSDIGQVSIDLNSPFIKQLVDTGKLEIAVRPLKELGSNVVKFNQKLDATTLKDSDEISLLLDKLKDLNRGTSDIPTIMNAAAVLGSCATQRNPPSDQGNKNMIGKVTNLDDQISNARKLIKEIREVLISNKNLLEETIKACSAIDKNDQQEINAEFKKFLANQKVSETVVFIDDLNTKLTDVDKTSSFAKEVEQMLPKVDDYYSKVSVYQPFFDCLRKEKNRNIVFSAVYISKHLRENATDFTESVDKVIGVAKKVIGTKGDLKVMDSTLKKMKGLKSPEVDALKLFSDAQKHSNAIGGATQGVVSMTKAIKEKDNLVAGFGLVEAGMKKVGLRSKRAISAQDLNSLLATKGQVDQMFNSLGQFNNGAKDLKVKKFQDLSAIFPDAQKISGVKLDFPAIGQSVGELADKINDASSPGLKKLQSTLNSLDLDFSKHQKDFADSKSSLGQLDAFFAKIKTALAPVPASSDPNSSDLQSKQDQTPAWLIVVIVLGIFLFAAAIAAIVWYIVHPCCFTKKEDPETGKGGKKLENTTTTIKLEVGLDYLHKTFTLIQKFKENEIHVYDNDTDLFCGFFHSMFNIVQLNCDNPKEVPAPQMVLDNLRECRYKMALVLENRIVIQKGNYEFATDFIHANMVTFNSGLRFIISQAPQDGFRMKKKGDEKKEGIDANAKAENILKTWIMVRQETVKDIVMLCQRSEMNKKGELETKCGKYFPEEVGEVLTLEMLTIKCIKKTSMFDDQVILRTITVKFDDSEEFTVRHFQFLAWPDFGVPTNLTTIFGLLKLVRLNKTPVYVHCAAGLGRSGSFAMIEMGYEELCETGNVHFSKLLFNLRDQRAESVQKDDQLAFAVCSIVRWGIEEALVDPNHPKLTKEQLAEWNFIEQGFAGFAKTKNKLEKEKKENEKKKEEAMKKDGAKKAENKK